MVAFPLITPWSLESLGPFIASVAGTGLTSTASAAIPAADEAIYVPFAVDQSFTAVKLWAVNGATAAGNIDVAVYSAAGAKLTSAAQTAQSGTNTLQVFDITDVVLTPGLYYLAVVCSSATATLFRGTLGSAALAQYGGMAQETLGSGAALPSTATMAANSRAYIPLIGVSGRTLV